ncbi:hypothetical protein IGI04_030550 [Brassica rapa subsp. trilocularis]|uniref:ACB domain-containing protein n=2 Tax=Brassica TaxID=3705 RepID=A0ABQ7LUD3_BRACM|nr:hypothetical protein IGI04_030550 [Brassica rapa subsp. trilocularis]
MGLKEDFEEHADNVKKLTTSPSNEDLLILQRRTHLWWFNLLNPFKILTHVKIESGSATVILYGLYKQATVGPVTTSSPGMFSMKERAKWDAWKAVEGKSTDEAMSDYITKVKQLLEAEAAAAST